MRSGSPTPASPEGERFVLRPRRIVFWIVALFALIFLLHYAAMVSKFVLGHGRLYGVVDLLNVDEEESLSTYVQSLLLLSAAGLLFVIARATRRRGGAHVFGWYAMSAIFLYLSVDEASRMHEMLIVPLHNALDAGGIFFFTWIVVAIPLVVVFAIVYIPFLRDLEPTTRRLLILAGLLYLSGTIGMEMAGGVWAERNGFDNRGYLMLFVPIEEVFEIAGQTTLLYALTRYLPFVTPAVTLHASAGDAPDADRAEAAPVEAR